MNPIPVWRGATAALVMISVLGVWIGRTVLQHPPLFWLHRISGFVFLLFYFLARGKAIS